MLQAFFRERWHRLGISFLLWIWISILLSAWQGVGAFGATTPVIVYVGLLLSSGFFQKRWLRYSILILALLIVIKGVYYPFIPWQQPFVFIATWIGQLRLGFVAILHRDQQTLIDFVRVLAFLGVLTFGTRLLEEGATKPYWMMLSLIVGEFALIGFNVTQHQQPIFAIVVFLLVGLVLLLWTRLPQLTHATQQLSWRQIVFQGIVPVLVVTTMVVVGLWIPKPSASWPKPQSLYRILQLLTFHAGGASYGANDNALGGPFNGSQAVDLKVIANAPSYYQGDVLTDYTGTGWLPTSASSLKETSGKTISSALTTDIGPTVELASSKVHTTITVEKGTYPVAFVPYQFASVVAPKGQSSYVIRPARDAVSFGTLSPGETYSATSYVPVVSYHELASVNDGNLSYGFPQELSLPPTIPARVIELAKSITGGKQGTLAQIEAIIHYLDTHETYQTQGIPYLQPGQDFVDQFLFVTHKGYCDYFSTALAVLARAVGIPTRWAQGFIAVSANPSYHGPLHEYLERGVDAHSWTQVWFAGYGWVPFDATPASGENAVTSPNNTSYQSPGVTTTNASSKGLTIGHRGTIKDHGWLLIVSTGFLFLVVLLSVWLLWRRRKIRQKRSGNTRDQRLEGLLLSFYQLVGAKRSDLTLREFVEQDDRFVDFDEECSGKVPKSLALRFVAWYEEMRYGDPSLPIYFEEGQKQMQALVDAVRQRRRLTKKKIAGRSKGRM